MNFNEWIEQDPLMKPILAGKNYRAGRDLALQLARSRLAKADLAQLAQVPVNTVQAALAGHPAISLTTYQQLLAVLLINQLLTK